MGIHCLGLQGTRYNIVQDYGEPDYSVVQDYREPDTMYCTVVQDYGEHDTVQSRTTGNLIPCTVQ